VISLTANFGKVNEIANKLHRKYQCAKLCQQTCHNVMDFLYFSGGLRQFNDILYPLIRGFTILHWFVKIGTWVDLIKK